MQIRDYLSIAAIVISILGFCIAFQNARFTRRVRLAELRSTVLTKAVDVSNGLFSLRQIYGAAHGSSEGELARFKEFDSTVAKMQAQHMQNYDAISSARRDLCLEMYEKFFHSLHDINSQLLALNVSAQKIVDNRGL